MCGCLLRAPYWGPGLQPRHVPSLGIKLETFQFVGSTQFTEPHQPGLAPYFIRHGQKRRGKGLQEIHW